MSNLSTLFDRYKALVVFDTETSGLDFDSDQIIELAALRVERTATCGLRIAGKMDTFIKLPEGETLPENIVSLTGITDERLQTEGVQPAKAASQIAKLMQNGPTLMIAHNAQFDACFLRSLLRGQKVGRIDWLDSLTVYKDRRAYPHKLANAIIAYDLTGKVQNSHRAIDDVLALFEVLKAMDDEREDLGSYDKTVPFEVLSNKFAGILYSLELSSDDNQVVHEEAGSRAAGTLPTSPELEQATPMPDPTLTVDDMRSYGYLDGDMLPLSKDRALELLEHDITVYMLHPDNAEEMVFEAEDIIKHDGMFGITQPDWDAVKGHIPPRDVEQRFLNSPTDSMAIYQLRRDAPVELRFASLGSLAAPPDPANYEAIYTREVYPDDDTGRILENFYYIFNDERPGDFVGHSLSVSDIVALKQDGKVSYHYCDSMGFQELPAFQKPENYLKAAEMSMEDDYGMIDGIINNGPKQPTVADLEAQVKAGMSISLMDLAEAAHREKKKSVLEQLKNQPAQERPHKTAPKKSAEKEL